MDALRAAAFGQARRKYHWTPELRDELRRAYCRNKTKLGAALDLLERRTGWPRHGLKYEAIRLGIVTADHRRAWSAEDLEYLRERLGSASAHQIARRLGRSIASVQSRAEKLEISYRVREGYTMADLARVFGESYCKVRRWIERGLLGPVRVANGHRVSDRCLSRFLRRHHGEYDLRRVDQDWYKAMLFGYLAEV